MSDVGTGQTPAKCRVRSLINQELPLLKDHLMRLDPESRRDRFNGYADEGFVESYTAKCAGDGTIIMAYFAEDGAVHAAAELHQPDLSSDSLPELAFSVESHLRRKGVGSILFKKLIAVATELGYERLRITTGSQNQAMRALANKFGAHLTFRQGESTGTIELHPNIEAPSFANPQPEPLAHDVPPDAAKALIDFNQTCWKLFLTMSGASKPA
ncbi:GNAT family N-acetyltransferase [Rhodopseudomonas pseudopalustris]|uniref:GNAT family N-acetyltransferase n=1 Tax=Rhodopseudomonas pseudopalustris TaxID=1513892 RepID=UPI000420142B